jgi:hypothetical protein
VKPVPSIANVKAVYVAHLTTNLVNVIGTLRQVSEVPAGNSSTSRCSSTPTPAHSAPALSRLPEAGVNPVPLITDVEAVYIVHLVANLINVVTTLRQVSEVSTGNGSTSCCSSTPMPVHSAPASSRLTRS